MEMIDHVFKNTNKYIECMPKLQRKKYGQFFTSKETAIFMADLFSIPQDCTSLSILDPGAGSGILSIALLERLESEPLVEKIELVCYENDDKILNLLQSNLEWVVEKSSKQISYKIINNNYILSQTHDYNSLLWANPDAKKFDIIIGNPPYMKLTKRAPEAIAMPDVCHGAPNMYFLFAAMSMFNLKNNGEMVYIIPRSWTSGAYFKQFRKKFFKDCVLEHIHLFICRDKVFEKENVLQETIIIKAKKTHNKPKTINISTTNNSADFSNITFFEAPYTTVVKGENFYVYLVTSEEDILTLNKLNNCKNTLLDIGLKMKTGLTVDFRHSKILRNVSEQNAYPLFYSQHIKNGKVLFPVGKENEYIVTDKASLLQENTNYLFVKRFTAKEEHRRLQCGIYLARKYPTYKKISTQNKINFICGLNKLSECVVYGLYVVFNSKLYDIYYRILNGSTQVNATEINSMPVPSIDIIEKMGKELMRIKDLSEETCDKILRSYIWEN